jgi:hypothetical protein
MFVTKIFALALGETDDLTESVDFHPKHMAACAHALQVEFILLSN